MQPPLSASPSPPPLRAVLQHVRAALRANLLPALALQSFAVLVGLAYAFVPRVHDAFWHVGALKFQMGLFFALLSTACFGGLLPWIIQWLRPGQPSAPWSDGLFLACFWGIKGVEIELFYRLQALIWGEVATPQAVAGKVMMDQLVYAPLWAVPTMVLAFAWKNAGYRILPAVTQLKHQGFLPELLRLLIPNWGIWVPAVVVIYLLPLPLQLLVQNLVLCFFSLLLLFLTRPEAPADPATAPPLLEENPA